MINDFNQVIDCIYKNERYSVRDNGGVFRHPVVGKRARPNDNQWTFGKVNQDSGYMVIASVPIHRIVATAFHGEPPSLGHVVDHIDTNKQNNRQENLRWVTRLENILLNPITAKRIAIVYCTAFSFLTTWLKLFPTAFSSDFIRISSAIKASKDWSRVRTVTLPWNSRFLM
jgi:hypothetical protein